MAKIVILGSRGQLGSDLWQILSTHPNQHQVFGLTSADLDAASPEAILVLEQYADADYIINCIATTNVDGCEDNPQLALAVNSAFVVTLAQFCARQQITLIQISTDYVFDGQQETPYSEADQPNPLSVYGISKYAAELAVQADCPQHFILRVSSLFGIAGASGKGGNFVTTMLRLAKERESWTVINDQYTCPTHTLDIARAIAALIQGQVVAYGVYNCVSSTSCSWFEFAQQILLLAGHDPAKVKPISYHEYAFKAKRPQHVVLASQRMASIYTMPSYQVALQEYLNLHLNS